MEGDRLHLGHLQTMVVWLRTFVFCFMFW